jgi:hypothetical protein
MAVEQLSRTQLTLFPSELGLELYRHRSGGGGDYSPPLISCVDTPSLSSVLLARHLFIGILSALMIPIQVIMVPLFLVVADLGLLNNYWGVISRAQRKRLAYSWCASHDQYSGRAAGGRPS